MLSITHHLARRLEMAEAEDGIACVESQRLLDPEAGAISEPFLGGYLLFVGAGSPFTHALGLGLAGAVTEADVERMEDFYHGRGAGVTVDVCPYADSTLLETLSKRNYNIAEFATVLVRRISAGEQIPEAAGAPLAKVAAASETGLYAETVVRGFFGREAMPGTLAYFALLEGVLAGCGQSAFHKGAATLLMRVHKG